MNLWKYIFILRRNSQEEGFVIPLVLGIGLLMLLTGITMVQRGSNSEINSKLQKKTAQSLAAAETGLSFFQNVLNTNRALAVYDDCVSGRSAEGVCGDDEDDEPSWSNTVAITTTTKSSGCIDKLPESAVEKLEESAKELAWQPIDPNDPSKGQYRLVSFDYTADDPSDPFSAPGVGVLTVQGRTDQGDNSAVSANSDDAFNTGVTRLQAEIRIKRNTYDTRSSIPGLWIEASNYMDVGNNQIQGDILIEDLNCDLVDPNTGEALVPSEFSYTIVDGVKIWDNVTSYTIEDPATGNSETIYPQVETSQAAMPDTPDLPPDEELNFLTHTTSVDEVGDTFPRGTVDPVTGILTITDTVGSDGNYHYLVPHIDKNTDDIGIREGYTVIFYVQGNIEISGNANDPVNSPNTQAGNFQIYGNTTMPVAGTGYEDSNYKYGCYAGAGANDCPTQQVRYNGTSNMKAFMHIPEGALCIKGGGTDVPMTGMVWAKYWGNSVLDAPKLPGTACSNPSKPFVDASNVDPSLFLSAQTILTKTEPQVSSLATWERLEVE